MRDVVVRCRKDGVVEVSPRVAPADATDRVLLAGTVLLVAAALFVCGELPALALAAIAGSCLAGEVFLGGKALALALLRPAARIHEVPRWRPSAAIAGRAEPRRSP